MEPQHGHSPVVLSPSSMKMNGSVHHRHNLNLSSLSTSSAKHTLPNSSLIHGGEPRISIGGSANTSTLLEALNLPPSHVVAERSSDVVVTNRQRNLSQSRCQFRDHHVHELLGLLALLSIMSLLLAFVAIMFFLKITPPAGGEFQVGAMDVKRFLSPDECRVVYEVVVALAVCTISMDFTCFLVCTAQFLFAAKLLKVSQGCDRADKYLQCGSCSRGIATCGFFISIPVFLTGIILYAFIHFQNTSAIATGALLGAGILISGIAIIHNTHLWQKEQARSIATTEKSDIRVNCNDSPKSSNPSTSIIPPTELSTLV